MTADTCALCGEPLDQDGQCVACNAWTLEPLSEEDIRLMLADLEEVTR